MCERERVGRRRRKKKESQYKMGEESTIALTNTNSIIKITDNNG